MKHVFLTSDVGCIKKIDGVRVVDPIDDSNGIIEQIKSCLVKEDSFVYFASNPSCFEITDMYAKFVFDSFKLSGFNFKNYIIIDDRFNGDLKSIVDSADVIFLTGGDTKTQMDFFERIGLRDILKDYEGVVIGQSAGSMNLANLVVCPPDKEDISTYTWNGLGIVDINIEPHFSEDIFYKDDFYSNKLKELSNTYPLYAYGDGTHIYYDGSNYTIYGDVYYLFDSKLEKIDSVNYKK